MRVILFAVCLLAAMTPSSSFAQGENVELVGSIGGSVPDVAVQGDYAYICEGPHFTILDVSDTSAPQVIATLRLSDLAQSIAVSGSLAFVTVRFSGLQVVDISDPSAPVLLGSYDTPGDAVGIAVSGSIAYVADGLSGLQIIDVSDPSTPILLSSYDTPDRALGVAVSGSLAYVAAWRGGHLEIIDVSDPSAPFRVGVYDRLGFAVGVAVSGTLAYVADGLSGLQIIDVSDPSAPDGLGSYDTPGFAGVVAVSGSLAFVADSSSGLQIIDVSDPSEPVLLGSYDTPGEASALVVSGSVAYVADQPSGLQIIDVSDPSAPFRVGAYGGLGAAEEVAISGSLAYVVDLLSGLRIIDVSDPSAPVLLGSYDTPDHAYDVAVSGSVAYVAAGTSGLQIIDVSDPLAPVSLGSYDTRRSARGVAVSGSLAYVADWFTGGLQIIDVSDPSTPVSLGSYDTPDAAYGVAISGSLAFVANYRSGLQIVDVSEPSMPILLGSYDTPGTAWGVTLSGSLALVADGGSGGLQVIDVSDPSEPIGRGSYNTLGGAFDVAVSGSLAYVADTFSGLQIIGISNPLAPVRGGFTNTPGTARGVAVSGSLAYVADSGGGLSIFRYTGPIPPTPTPLPISSPRDVIIGDFGPAASSATGTNIFVFPDAFDVRILLPESATSLSLKWSFREAAGAIKINGVASNSGDVLDPPSSARLDTNDNDAGEAGDPSDSEPLTLTIRNVLDLEDDAGNVDAFDDTNSQVLDQRMVTLYVSNGAFATSVSMMVYTVNNVEDSLTGAAATPEVRQDLTDLATQRNWWSGGFFPDPRVTTSPTLGLCLEAIDNPAGGFNFLQWSSPEDLISLSQNRVYRVRVTLSTDQGDPNLIPVMDMTYDNLKAAIGSINYGGQHHLLSKIPGFPAGVGVFTNIFEFWFTPNAVALPSWNGTLGNADDAFSAFAPDAAARRDMRMSFRVIDVDANVALGSDIDVGMICMSRLDVDSFNINDLRVEQVIFGPPVDASAFSQDDFLGDNELSFVAGGARFALDDTQEPILVNPNDAVFVQIAPDNGVGGLLDDETMTVENPLRFAPVDRENFSLYRMRVLITSEGVGTASEGTLDAVDAIQLNWLAPTTEQGQSDFTVRAVPGPDPAVAVMNQAASPHPGVTNEYQSYLFTNKITLNTDIVGLTRIKPFVQFFNTAAFGVDLSVVGLDGAPSGSDPFVVESFIVEKLQTP